MSGIAPIASSGSSEEYDGIEKILHSLGIDEYDPLVVMALSEYTRRKFISPLLYHSI